MFHYSYMQKELHPILCLIGESGGGKTSLILEAVKRLPERLAMIKSITTRPQREQDDVATYDFISQDDFETREREGRLLQSVAAFGNRYGTDRDYVNNLLKDRIGIFVMVEEGIRQYQEAGYDVRIVRVIPHGHIPRDGRTEEDAKRKKLFGLKADVTIVNDFALGGFEKAVEELVEFAKTLS